MFEPIKNEKLYQMVVKQVKALIEKGQLEPGSQLPSERELAKLLSVSRTSVRQAITALEAMKILDIRHGEGTFVAIETANKDIIDAFSNQLVELQLFPDEILESRMILEGPLARMCADRATPEDISKIKSMLEHNRDVLGDKLSLEEMNRDFHLAIAEGAGNRSLYIQAKALYTMMEFNLWPRLKGFMEKNTEIIELHLLQHLEIFEAISSKKPDLAEKLMINHLKSIEHEFQEEAQRIIEEKED